ncbi:hypothetical protein AAH095_22940, partial [Phocaeicola vulgatus]
LGCHQLQYRFQVKNIQTDNMRIIIYFLCEVLPPCSVGWLAMTMLKHYNILIRECSDKEGFDGKQYIRIAVRNHEDNAKLVNAFKEIDEQCKQMMK